MPQRRSPLPPMPDGFSTETNTWCVPLAGAQVIKEALPEFLGSLGASLILTVGTWLVQRRRSRRPRPPSPPPRGGLPTPPGSAPPSP